ncbi:MAG: transposase, partial [Rubrivivax sp.]|nr:transposase [Rubrivivax sp.]
MARLPRLAIPGHPHYLILRGHSGQAVLTDDADRELFLAALREACSQHGVAVHAYALLDNEVQLLLTPPTAAALSRCVQALGRRYVPAFNRRHGRSGTLWDGRFHGAVVEAGARLLTVLLLIDGLGGAEPGAASALQSSAAHRLGRQRQAWLVDPPELWQLGNTPFEREAAYGRRLSQGLGSTELDALRQAALRGWGIGSPDFLGAQAGSAGRPLQPRPR